MSDEPAPKLRLKPKLTADPVAQQPATASTPPVEVPPAAPAASAEPAQAAEAAQVVRLKPRLSVAPMQEAAAASASTPPQEIPVPAAEPPAPAPEPEPAAEKPAVKFSFKAKSAPPLPVAEEEALPPLEPPPGFAPPPPVLNAPSPGVETDRGEGGEPAEITAMRQASDAPFPPPVPAKFPSPPGMKQNLVEEESDASFPPRPVGVPKAKPKVANKKKLIMIGGGALAAVLVLGSGTFFFLRTKAEPPPKAAVKPAPEPVAGTPKVEETPAPVAEAPAAETPAVVPEKPVEKPAPVVVEPEPAPEPEPPPPPPPASAAFKAWVENLKISGVRAGSSTRVFIERTSYAVGDLVNPQLGITFEGYNSETRLLTFKDKTGAVVTRRN